VEDPEWRPLLTEEIVRARRRVLRRLGVNIRIMATTLPLKQWDVARELRRRSRTASTPKGIEIPFPHRTLYWGEGQNPATGREREREQER
jgi:moderate conductance mechanosensitive channel